MTPAIADLLDLLSLEDIPDAAERIAAFRAKVRELPEPERSRLEADLRAAEREIAAQARNEERRRRGARAWRQNQSKRPTEGVFPPDIRMMRERAGPRQVGSVAGVDWVLIDFQSGKASATRIRVPGHPVITSRRYSKGFTPRRWQVPKSE